MYYLLKNVLWNFLQNRWSQLYLQRNSGCFNRIPTTISQYPCSTGSGGWAASVLHKALGGKNFGTLSSESTSNRVSRSRALCVSTCYRFCCTDLKHINLFNVGERYDLYSIFHFHEQWEQNKDFCKGMMLLRFKPFSASTSL